MRATLALPIVITTIAGCIFTEDVGSSGQNESAEAEPTEIEPGAFEHVWSHAAGGTGDDWARPVLVHPSGDLLVAGRVSGKTSLGDAPLGGPGNPGSSFLARIAVDDGAVVWARTFGSVGLASVDVADDGQIVAVAREAQEETTLDGVVLPAGSSLLLAFAEDGSLEWAKPLMAGVYVRHVSVAPDGHLYVAGFWMAPGGLGIDAAPKVEVRNSVVARLTSDGTLVWRKDFETSANDLVECIRATASGVVVAGGFGISDFESPNLTVDGHLFENPGNGGAFVIAFDSEGLWAWGHGFGGPSVDYVQDVALGDDGSVFVSGEFSGDATFPSGEASATEPNRDGFLLKLTGSGEPVYHVILDGSFGANVAAMAVDATGTYLAGSWDGDSLRVGDRLSPPQPPHSSYNDMYIAHLAPDGAVGWLRVFRGEEDIGHENALDIVPVAPGRVAVAGDFSGSNQPARLDLGGAPLEGGRGHDDMFMGVLDLELGPSPVE